MPKSKEAKNSSKSEQKKDKTKKSKKGDKAKDALKAGQKDKPKKKQKARRNALKGKRGLNSDQFDAVIDILRGPNSESFKKAMIGHWMDEHEKEQAALKKEGVI
jgi:hypothetical protein